MGTTASAPGDDRAQTTAPHADDDLALAGLRAQAALIASLAARRFWPNG